MDRQSEFYKLGTTSVFYIGYLFCILFSKNYVYTQKIIQLAKTKPINYNLIKRFQNKWYQTMIYITLVYSWANVAMFIHGILHKKPNNMIGAVVTPMIHLILALWIKNYLNVWFLKIWIICLLILISLFAILFVVFLFYAAINQFELSTT